MLLVIPLSFSDFQRRTVLVAVMLCSACATSVPTGVSMVCMVAQSASRGNDCPSVPSLSEGVLTLSEDGSFTLNGRYDACYQVEDVQMSGTYVSEPHENGIDMELLATRSQTDNQQSRALSQTIGLLNLDGQSLEARFTDTAAVIRSRGQLSTPAPSVQMSCERR